jgi:hypothetical protein
MFRRMVWPLAVLLAVVSGKRCVASANDSSPCPDPPGAEYLLALGVVDQFLGAWNLRDESKGIELVSDSLRKRVGNEKLRDYVSGLSDPYHSSFTVGCGGRIQKGAQTFEFPVILYFYYNGEATGSGYRSSIQVGRTKDCKGYTQGWCVDSLPSSYDLEVGN